MLATLVLLAADPSAQDSAPIWSSFIPIVFMVLFGYLLLFRPAQRQEQQRKALILALKKNDKIVNSGGIIGIVDSIKEKEDEVVLKGGLRVLKSSIVRVVSPEEPIKEQQ